jgi:hypothetical protein
MAKVNSTKAINGFSLATAADMKTTTTGNSMTAIHERLRDALNNKEIEYPCEGKTPKKAVAALNAFLKDRVTPKPKVSLHADPTRTDVVLIMKK